MKNGAAVLLPGEFSHHIRVERFALRTSEVQSPLLAASPSFAARDMLPL